MNAAIVVVAVAFLVLAALAVVFTAVRRRDAERAVGYLSRETRSRDRAATPTRDLQAPTTGREIEVAAAAERRDAGKELVAAGPSAPVPYIPPDADALAVSRRQFLNRGIVTGFVLGLSGFGASMLAFLWPQVSGGFGSKITVGKVTDLKSQVDLNSGFLYYPEGRMWITEYPAAALDKARAVYTPSELAGMEAGLVALYQKCVHLGCRVPECVTSQWFECPCHGSQYNQVGEKKGGPAPRGLDRFAMSVEGGNFVVDTGIIIQGPAIGTNTTGQEAEGPHCITGGGEAH
jgi:cytochrome b6-f complex iron-sulfur subunit